MDRKTQILAVLGTIGTMLVNYGLVSNTTEQKYIGIAAIVLPVVLMIADAVIKLGHSNVAVAQLHADSQLKQAAIAYGWDPVAMKPLPQPAGPAAADPPPAVDPPA